MNRFTEMIDVNYDDIYVEQKVNMLGNIGSVVFECGSYGIGFDKGIDYEKLQSEMDSMSHCCGNKWYGCMNDNFVSLWEIYWNFNCDEDCIDVIEIMEG